MLSHHTCVHACPHEATKGIVQVISVRLWQYRVQSEHLISCIIDVHYVDVRWLLCIFHLWGKRSIRLRCHGHPPRFLRLLNHVLYMGVGVDVTSTDRSPSIWELIISMTTLIFIMKCTPGMLISCKCSVKCSHVTVSSALYWIVMWCSLCERLTY